MIQAGALAGWRGSIFRTSLSLQFLGAFVALITGIIAIVQPIPVFVILGIATLFLLLSLVHPVAPLIVMLILAPMRVLIATEAPFQLPIDIGQLGLILFLSASLITRILKVRVGTIKLSDLWTPFSAALVFFILVTGLSAFAAASISAWLLEWVKWIQILLLMTVIISAFKRISWEWLVFGLVLAGVANAFVGIYEFFGGSGALHLLINDRYFRAFGTFGQPNPFGGFMGLLIPLSVTSAIGYAIRWSKSRGTGHSLNMGLTTFYGFASIILIIGMGMSWSRGAWLGLGAAFLMLGLAVPRQFKNGLAVFVGLACILLILWTSGLLPQSIVQRLQTSTQEFFAFEDVRGVDITPDNFAVAERLAHWQAAINMFTDYPWLGIGFGNYATRYPQYGLMNWLEPLGHAHNYYLNILAEVGIIGLLGYGKVWVTIFHRTWEAKSHPDNFARYIAIGLLGSWTYLAVHSFFDNLYVNNLFLHLAVMLSVIVLIHRDLKSSLRI